MEPIRLVGIGSYLPKRMHDNESLPALDKPLSRAEIDKIGVYRRGWADDSESIAEMAAEAGRRALARAELAAEDLDLVILANWTQRRYTPEHAPRLLRLLGARRAIGFDVCCACAGFLYGVAMASSMLQARSWSNALVVGSETTSRRARPGSKGTLILGDAAGSFVLQRGTTRGGRILDTELLTDGDHADILDISPDGHVRTHIAQRELNALAARSFQLVTSRLLARRGLTIADVTWIVPHSGTAGVQHAIREALGVPDDKILTNFSSVGNVSSASIPTALDDYLGRGTVRPGDLILSAAVGTGWYAAAALYTV